MRWPVVLLLVPLAGCIGGSGGPVEDDAAAPSASFVHDGSALAGPAGLAPGWTQVRLENTGAVLAQAVFFAVPDDRDAAAFQAALVEGMPPWAEAVGGPGAVVPGATGQTTIHLSPGSYVVADLLPGPTGLPAAVHGVVADLHVSGKDTAAPRPQADVRADLVDFAFRLDGDLTAGPVVLEVRNVGGHAHELVLVRIEDGASTASSEASVARSHGAVGGTGALSQERTAFLHAELEAGTYALMCLMQGSGAPHVAQGMLHVQDVR